MSLNSIIELIKDVKFEILIQNAEEYSKCIKSGKDVEHILGVCSHVIFNTGTFPNGALSSMSKMVIFHLQRAASKSFEINSLNVLKHLYYILVHGVRKGLDIDAALNLIKEIESLLNSCEEFSINHPDLLKKMHSTLWNVSLQKGMRPDDALVLQGHALGFLSLVSKSFHDSCTFTNRVGKLAEHNKCSIRNIENLYRKILTTLITTLKRKPVISSISVIAVNQILIEFAKTLYVNKKCNEFSKIFKPLVVSLEALCDMKVILSLKMSVKIVEVGITFALDQSNKETLLKYLSGCSVVSKSSSEANTILVDGLYFIYQLLQEKKTSSKRTQVVTSIFRCITDRIKPECNFSNDTLTRILDLYGTHLNNYVTLITENNNDTESLITEAGKCSSALSNLMNKVGHLVGETQVYNIGINSFNLGVIAFKNRNYDIASKLLDYGVKYLFANYGMCNENQKNSIMSIIKKKAIILKDSLRYSGKFKEAATKTLHLVALKILPRDEFKTTWIKCKRDAQKMNCLNFQKTSLIDIYNEVQSELSDSNKLTIKVEEFLVEAIKEFELFSVDTYDEQIIYAVALMNSNIPKFSLDGSIAYAILLWSNPEKRTDESSSIINILRKALLKIEKSYTKNEIASALEYKAEIEFWMYLSNLQIIQEKAELEIEETLKENEPLTVQSTDLGEEVQPNDVCSVRPSTTVNTFDCQEKNSQHLHQALDYWEQVVKGRKVSKPKIACRNLLSIGFIYKLNGVLPSFIKAFTFLLQVANLYDLEEYWIQGVLELIDIIPELLSIKIAQRLLDLLKADASKTNHKITDYLRLSTLSSVSYLYYRKGMYSDGATLIKECLSNPIMNKRTPSATEAQIGVFLVASYYAFLPKSILPTDLKPEGNCLFLALNATRKAIGLANASADFNNGIICWRHKVAWLHHNANMWLGRLCYITAQPRLARAYLRQSLSLAEKFALPLRTAELFCTLAEIDLQCDQLDDCRVKIDSLNSLLKVHSFDIRDSFPLEKDLKNGKHLMQTSSCVQGELKSTISIYIDNDSSVDENMRDGKVSPGFVLLEPKLHLGNQLPAHGVKKGIDLLQQNCPPSPSSEKFVVRSVHSCPKGVENCCLCMAPELHSVSVRANVLMGVIYAQRDNEKESQRCFTQAQKDLEQMMNSCSEIVSSLCSILKLMSTNGTCLINDNENEKDQFIRILMSPAYLSLLFNRNEILCLNISNWDSMESKALETLRNVNEQSPMILTLNHPFVLQLILQCHAISRTVRSREERTEISPIETECSPLNPSKTEALSFKTPLKSSVQKKFNPFLSVSKEQHTFTPFKIFTDESDSSSSGERKNLKKGAKGRKEKEIKNLASSFDKLSVETNAPYCKLNFSGASTTSPSFSPLGSQNKSPFSKALELPNRKAVKPAGDETSTLTSQTKLKKLVSKNLRSSGETPSIEEIKENSPPIIKSKLPRRGRPTSATTTITTTTTTTTRTARAKTTTAPSATAATRETRSRRNLKRL